MKVAILAGRPKNGTILPKNEKFVWNEVCRVMEEELSLPLFKGATFLIPIYNKFDLYALAIAEKNNNPIEYYVPSMEWGTSSLPKHQTLLVGRMNHERHLNPSNFGRITQMIEDADLVYVLPGTDGFERFDKDLANKPLCRLDTNKMNFTTEETGLAYYEMLKQNTTIYLGAKELSQNEDQLTEREALEILFGDAGIPLEFED